MSSVRFDFEPKSMEHCTVDFYETNHGIVLIEKKPNRPSDVLSFLDGHMLGIPERGIPSPEQVQFAKQNGRVIFKLMIDAHNLALGEGRAQGAASAQLDMRRAMGLGK